jgi:sec-independent protein translocase protein TatB
VEIFNIGPFELIVILTLALIVFGPEKLPELMRSAGHAVREFQRYSSELTATFQETQAEFTSALDVSEVTDAVQEAVESVSVNGTVHEPVPETPSYAPAETPVEPQPAHLTPVFATSAPSEYETAAAMVEPVAPFPEPLAQEPPAPGVVEAATAAPVVPDAEATEAPKARRVRKKAVEAEPVGVAAPAPDSVESA